jgi:phage tail-like protein
LIDVNQSRFQLVYGEADWYGAGTASSPAGQPLFDWDDSTGTLGLHQELFIFPPLSGQLPLTEDTRRGAGMDRYGNWYWIAPSQTEIRFLGMNEQASEHFWSSPDGIADCPVTGDFVGATSPTPPADLVFSGLAVTAQHYLVAGVLDPKGLLVFDLYSGGLPSQLRWPAAVPFTPFDMTPTAAGGVLILDRANKTYWELDRELRVLQARPAAAPAAPEIFQPVGPAAPRQAFCTSTGPISAQSAVSLAAFSDPVAIEALPDGSLVILENPPGAAHSVVRRFWNGAQAGPPVGLKQALALYVLDEPTPQNLFPDAVRGYDFAFVAAAAQPGPLGILYIAQIEGDQTFAFDLTLTAAGFSLTVEPRYFPMRHFAGKALVAASAGAAVTGVYYDYQDTWVPLAQQPRPLYQQRAQLLLPQPPPGASPAVQGMFDGKLPGCVWHRLCLEACIPAGAAVTVESRAADLAQLLPNTEWQLEPTPYLRGDGPEIPYYQTQLQGTSNRVGTWELLFQAARGRYLQLRLTLTGTGRNTPHLYALRAWYPRFSYLRQYLPAVYSNDPVSASFLDRFLANVEGLYTVLEGKIQEVQELFDPLTIPSEYLDWLASWMSIVLDPSWRDSTRRLVLSHAPQMFQERGTPDGIMRAIRLMLEPCPDESLFTESNCGAGSCSTSEVFTVRLVEKFLTRAAPGVVFGDPTDVAGPGSVAPESAWTPAQGPNPLNAQFRCYFQTQYSSIAALNQSWGTNYASFNDPTLTLPPVQPAQSAQALDWSHFLRDTLGFTYAPVSSSDVGSYQAYLAQLYPTIGDLNAAYQLVAPNLYASFSGIPLPTAMPAGGQQLQDWILFVSVALPIQQNAHQFTVLVPVSASDTPATQQSKLAIAQRVTDIEKPAHTSYDVRLYWGMFRAGEARLGLDTLLGPGSRFTALLLGSGYLAGNNLAPEVPITARDRRRLGIRSLSSQCRESKPQKRCV